MWHAVKRISLRESSNPSGLFIAIVTIAALYFARVVFIPLALALLFSLLLTPVVSFLERIKVPRILAILLVVFSLMGLVGFVGWRSSQQLVDLTEQLPSYKSTLEEKIHSLRGAQSRGFNKASDTVHELAKEAEAATPGSPAANEKTKTHPAPGSSPSTPMAVEVVPPTNALEYVENVLGPVVLAGIIAIFTIFILIGREDLRNRFIRLAGRGRLHVMTQALDEATRRINRYLLLQLAVNLTYGIVIGIALHLIGIPNAALWGVTASVLRFLPYVGPPMAALIPILLSLAVFSGWSHALATVGVFFVLELLVSNFVEPLLYGTHVGLSPLAILIAAIFWTLIWGLPGLLLSTPLTVCLVVMGRYIPDLNFFSILLGDEPVLSPHVQYYQRLLAADQNEARQVLELYLKDKTLDELYSEVVIPALGLAEQDRHRNELDEGTQNFIYQTTREIIDEMGDIPNPDLQVGEIPAEGGVADEAVRKSVDILCIPARDDADDVVALLLSQLLERKGYRAKSIPIGTTSEMLEQVEEAKPEVVCISALPPFALNHARDLYAKLRSRFPELHAIVCLWQFEGDAQKTATRLKLAPGHGFFTTLPQVLQHMALGMEKAASDGEKS
jgi:predicted PurR-regulated permease PerM